MKIRESCLQTGNFIYKPGISLTKQDFHLQRGILGLQRGFSGYYLPSSGKILYNGTDIKELDDRYREKIGFLPQNVGYYPNFTAKKTIEYFGYLRGVNKKELDSNVEQVLRDVNLYENRNDKVKSFSGGMKQRLGIAITCVANPEIIIFDEPTVGLDPEERARFKNLIRKLSKTKTIVLSTHILSDVEEVADYIILIKEGCLTKFEKIGGKDNE